MFEFLFTKALCISFWLAKHLIKECRDKRGAAAVRIGTELSQLIRFVQQLHDPLLLIERRHRNLYISDFAVIHGGIVCAGSPRDERFNKTRRPAECEKISAEYFFRWPENREAR